MTCTGFQTVDIRSWSDTAKLVLAAGMVFGGAAGSTAGDQGDPDDHPDEGVQWRFRRIISPRGAIVPFRIGPTVVDQAEVGQRLEDASLITFLWLVFLMLGVIVLLHTSPPGFTLSDVIFEVASAQGNVGLSVGITSPTMPILSKLALCFNMWIGRLEIIPVLMLIRAVFRGIQ